MLSDEGVSKVEQFLGNAIRWLTVREDERRVIVQPTQETFPGTRPVEFTGQVYDESYQPIENALVRVTVRRENEQYELELPSLGGGNYAGALGTLSEGEYSFAARVEQNAKTLGEDRGSFAVGDLNAEFLETRLNQRLLEQITSHTGGQYYHPSQVNRLVDDVIVGSGLSSRTTAHANDVELWNQTFMLALIVSLFALEWILRKRAGML
jgi:hypothetical protein